VAWSLLIRGGEVIDGTGAPRRRADVAVEGDRVAAVGPGLAGQARRIVDATGQVVTPGFIDIHSHSDLFYLETPAAESKLRQGCTTEVVGMCSFSPAPVPPGRPELIRTWAGGIGARLDLRWETFPQYLDALRAAMAAADAKQIEHIAHSLKGSAAILGAARLRDAALVLEDSAHDRHGDAGAPLVAQVAREVERVIAFFADPSWPDRLDVEAAS